MKKILLLLIVVLLSGCGNEQNPHRYRGCVVTDKAALGGHYRVQVKLTPGCKLNKPKEYDYLWFYTVKWEYEKLNIGDTIK